MTDLSALSSITCILAFFVLTLAAMLASSLRIVPEEKRLKVYRLGRYLGLKGPGLVLLIPLLDRSFLVDAESSIEQGSYLTRMVGMLGEASTTIYPDGEVQIDGKVWPAISERPIQASRPVRVKRIILDVEEAEEK